MEHRDLEKVLALSTAHMPCEKPDFGDSRVVSHEYGFILFCAAVEGPAWLAPILRAAGKSGCTLILFDRDGVEFTEFETWDW